MTKKNNPTFSNNFEAKAASTSTPLRINMSYSSSHPTLVMYFYHVSTGMIHAVAPLTREGDPLIVMFLPDSDA